MRPALPSPNENRYAVIASTAYTSRKSSFSPPGTVPACHVSPPSIVRTNVPPVPLAQTTFALTMLNPCKLAVVFDFWGVHCPNADAATRQVRRISIFTCASVLEKRVHSMRSSFSCYQQSVILLQDTLIDAAERA